VFCVLCMRALRNNGERADSKKGDIVAVPIDSVVGARAQHACSLHSRQLGRESVPLSKTDQLWRRSTKQPIASRTD
jgi:hypothetical protein